MRIERDYSHIKASLSRDASGRWVCEFSGVNGVWLLTLVATERKTKMKDVLQTALRCLSRKDLRKAAA